MLGVEAIRRMRGGSQSQLMMDAEQGLWVVKFQNNPQGIRILANELIVARLTEVIGLPVPKTAIVEVPETVIADDPKMVVQLPKGMSVPYLAGQQFGSGFMGGLMPGLAADFLRDDLLDELRNLNEFAGMLAVDKWTANCDGRQAVFHRTSRESRYRATFIDQGFCFRAGDWTFPDSPLLGAFSNHRVYMGVNSWTSFEPWLSNIETMEWTTLSRIAAAVPPIWYGGDPRMIERLMEQLFERRGRVREFIASFRDSDRRPFPSWKV